MLAFCEGLILMIKEGASPFGSVLGSPSLELHSQLSSLGWPCLRIESHKPLCSAFWSVLQISFTLCLLSRSARCLLVTIVQEDQICFKRSNQNGWGNCAGGCSVALKMGRSAYIVVSMGM